jgi:hypothetical protein
VQRLGDPRANIDLAVPGRPIRSLVAEDRSAEWRPRPDGTGTPMLTRLLTRLDATPRDKRVQDGTTIRHPSSSKAWWSLGEHRPRHRVGNLQRLALPGDSAEAVQSHELQGHRPCLSLERAILCRSRCRATRCDTPLGTTTQPCVENRKPRPRRAGASCQAEAGSALVG